MMGLLPVEVGQVSSSVSHLLRQNIDCKDTNLRSLLFAFMTMTLTSVAPYAGVVTVFSLSPVVGATFPPTLTTGPWSCT